ncbi:MAG: DUF4328 domain-containing protein [Mycobacteriaceae bacterium]|nr:DUF4328 domain-containing protein [Mycobacteriaceae bacterium]
MTMSTGQQPIRSGAGPVRPLGVLGGWVIGLVAATVVVQFISDFIDWAHYADFERRWDNPQSGSMPDWQSDLWAGVIAMVLLLGSGIVVIAWLWRARRNAEALCAAPHRLPVGWVIGGWFCPVVNFWFPHMLMTDVVRTSDPRTPADAEDLARFRGVPAPALVTAWWMLFVMSWLLDFVSLRLSTPELRSKTTGEYYVTAYSPSGGGSLVAVELIGTGLLAGAAICLGLLVIRVRQYQVARAGRPIAPAAAAPVTDAVPVTAVAPAAAPAPMPADDSPRHKHADTAVIVADSLPIAESGDIERSFGRVRDSWHAPEILDLDADRLRARIAVILAAHAAEGYTEVSVKTSTDNKPTLVHLDSFHPTRPDGWRPVRIANRGNGRFALYGHSSIYQVSEIPPDNADLVAELVTIGTTRGYLKPYEPGAGSIIDGRTKEIGRQLHSRGGIDMMRSVHAAVAERVRHHPGLARELEHAWDGIGSWQR